MMTRRTKSLVFGMALLSVIAFSIASTVAQGVTEEPIGTNTATRHMNAGETKAFKFRQQTRLMFKTNVSLQLNMDVDALEIGDKSVTVELNCSATEVVMNMTCRENQAELGLMNGSTVQTRTRNRVQVGGFAANISVNCTQLQARLRAQVGNLNGYVWAYWNGTTEEWVEVPTETIDGEAVADVDHFSTWTLLAPDASIGIEPTFVLLASAGAVAMLLVAYRVKRRF